MARTAEASQEVRSAFRDSVREGEERLHRSTPSLLATGMVGGIDIGVGLFGLLLVREATGSSLLAGLAFSIGLLAVIIARSELFTENFLIPIVAWTTRHATALDVVRLWAGTLGMNLAGGWIVTGVIVSAFPDLRETAIAVAEEGIAAGIGWTSFASAIFAGMLMTLLTWMHRATESEGGRIAATIGIGFLLGAATLNHAIVRSMELFAALQSGAPFGYGDWFVHLSWAVLGNMVGGIGLVTAVRLVQVGRQTRERAKNGVSEAGPRRRTR